MATKRPQIDISELLLHSKVPRLRSEDSNASITNALSYQTHTTNGRNGAIAGITTRSGERPL